MSGNSFVAMVNPKSGGNVGAQLLAKFKEILDDDRVYDLSEDGGPKRALAEHSKTEHLRIIGTKGLFLVPQRTYTVVSLDFNQLPSRRQMKKKGLCATSDVTSRDIV